MKEEMMKGLGAEEREKVAAVGKEFECKKTKEEMKREARKHLISRRFKRLGKDRVCLQELMVYGVKGVGAYTFHAIELGEGCGEVVEEIVRLLGEVLQEAEPSVEALLGACMDAGKANMRAMDHLDAANTRTFGHPEPTRVQWIHDAANGSEKPGKAILVTGHDLLELSKLLEQCEGKGIQVYTHGEMLPCEFGKTTTNTHSHFPTPRHTRLTASLSHSFSLSF